MTIIYRILFATTILSTPILAMANNVTAIGGDVKYYDLQSNLLGAIPANKLPNLPIPILEIDELHDRVKVRLSDGSLVWLDNLNLDLEHDSQVSFTCKSANTGKPDSTTLAVNMGFGKCEDTK